MVGAAARWRCAAGCGGSGLRHERVVRSGTDGFGAHVAWLCMLMLETDVHMHMVQL